MKFAVIGDPHGKVVAKSKIHGVDFILITGDLGKADLARQRFFENIEREKQGLKKLKPEKSFEKDCYLEIYDSALEVVSHYAEVAPVFVVFGNADLHDDEVRKTNEKFGLRLPYFVRDLRRISNMNILNNRFTNFNGVRIGGLEYFVDTSWVREFRPAKYSERLAKAQRQTQKVKRVLNWFRKNYVDVLLCHQPPYGILDVVGNLAPAQWRGKHAGSQTILKYIQRYSPQYVFCGHIHEGKGQRKVGETQIYNLGEGGYKTFEIPKGKK